FILSFPTRSSSDLKKYKQLKGKRFSSLDFLSCKNTKNPGSKIRDFSIDNKRFTLFYLIYNSFESFRMVHSKVCENFSVQLDVVLFKSAHKLGIRHSVFSGTSVDSGNPKRPEISFLLFSSAISVLHRFFYGVFGNCPNVLSSSEITFSQFHHFFSACSGSNGVY